MEVFADVLCPFTHVGLHTLIDRRAELGRTEPRLCVRAWPLELVNGRPLDPHHIAAEVAALRESVRADLFTGFSAESFPSTSMAAFAMTAAADRTGDAALIEEVGMTLRDAVFEQGLDIGQPDVVGSVCARFGLRPLDEAATAAAVRADWEEGRRRGVVGSPHFFTADGGSWFCPGLSIRRDDVGHFIVAWKEGSAAFVERVLS